MKSRQVQHCSTFQKKAGDNEEESSSSSSSNTNHNHNERIRNVVVILFTVTTSLLLVILCQQQQHRHDWNWNWTLMVNHYFLLNMTRRYLPVIRNNDLNLSTNKKRSRNIHNNNDKSTTTNSTTTTTTTTTPNTMHPAVVVVQSRPNFPSYLDYYNNNNQQQQPLIVWLTKNDKVSFDRVFQLKLSFDANPDPKDNWVATNVTLLPNVSDAPLTAKDDCPGCFDSFSAPKQTPTQKTYRGHGRQVLSQKKKDSDLSH
jgi:hypothetical protein